jgi:hypothetical protein
VSDPARGRAGVGGASCAGGANLTTEPAGARSDLRLSPIVGEGAGGHFSWILSVLKSERRSVVVNYGELRVVHAIELKQAVTG